MTALVILVFVIAALFAITRLFIRQEELVLDASLEILRVESGSFPADGFMPVRHTGYGDDASPELTLSGLSPDAQSIAVIMDDVDVPLVRVLNHWVIWNLPAESVIPGGIPFGETVDSLGGAVQGIGYGKHQYAGPKPPPFLKNTHEYKFYVFALDSELTLGSGAGKEELLASMDGHILQYGVLTGKYSNQERNSSI
jgi:Raf kinase inhibitor-like YbhB/YbcL family protein